QLHHVNVFPTLLQIGAQQSIQRIRYSLDESCGEVWIEAHIQQELLSTAQVAGGQVRAMGSDHPSSGEIVSVLAQKLRTFMHPHNITRIRGVRPMDQPLNIVYPVSFS